MRLRGLSYALISAMLFGLGAILAKLLSSAIDATVVAILSLTLGGLLLVGCLAFARMPLWRALRGLTAAEWGQVFLLACPGTALPLLVIVAGFARTSALEGGLLLQINGVAALLFAVVLLAERFRRSQSLGLLLLLLGGALVVVAGARGSAGGSSLGDLLILVGAVGIGFSYIPAKRLSLRLDPLTLSALRLLVGAVSLVPILAAQLLVGGPTLLWQPTATTLWILLGYCISNFCLAYLAQQAGLRLLPAWEMAAIGQTVPIFSTLAAVLLLHETLTPLQGMGGLLAVLGGLVVSLPKKAARAARPDEVSASSQDGGTGLTRKN